MSLSTSKNETGFDAAIEQLRLALEENLGSSIDGAEEVARLAEQLSGAREMLALQQREAAQIVAALTTLGHDCQDLIDAHTAASAERAAELKRRSAARFDNAEEI